MDTRNKLNEANYFLDLLQNFQTDENKLRYNLSAFLNAWRSVLDIMLYDFAEYYSLGFTREMQLTDKEVLAIATALGNSDAVKFVKWWRQKQGELMNNPLWEKRIISFHRGNVQIYQNIYTLGTGSASVTISHVSALGHVSSPAGSVSRRFKVPTEISYFFWSFTDFPNEDLINKCREGYSKLETIVMEAEKKFGISL